MQPHPNRKLTTQNRWVTVGFTRPAMPWSKLWQVSWQVALLWGLSAAGNWAAARMHSPIPGSILGFATLFLLLQCKVVKLHWISAGSDWLLANLLLWFIPAAVGIVQYGPLVRSDGAKLMLLIVTSITLVMGVTGLITDHIARRSDPGSRSAHLVDSSFTDDQGSNLCPTSHVELDS